MSIGQLKSLRDHHLELGYAHSEFYLRNWKYMSRDDRRVLLDTIADHNHKVRVLDQQLDWELRAERVAYPREPAWSY